MDISADLPDGIQYVKWGLAGLCGNLGRTVY